MVGWHHWPNGHEFEQTLGDGEGQRTLTCCSPWGSQIRTRLSNWTKVLPTGWLSMNPPSSMCTQKIQFLISFCIPWLTSHPSAKLCWIPREKLQSFSPHRDLPSPTKSHSFISWRPALGSLWILNCPKNKIEVRFHFLFFTMQDFTYTRGGRVLRDIYARLPRKAFDCNGLESRILDTFQGVPLILDHLPQWCRAMVSLKFFQ